MLLLKLLRKFMLHQSINHMNRILRKFLMIVIATLAMINLCAQQSSDLIGAWERKTGDTVEMVICSEKNFAYAKYTSKTFLLAQGGTWKLKNGIMFFRNEFNSKSNMFSDSSKVAVQMPQKDKLIMMVQLIMGTPREYSRVDNGTPGQLAGAWLITGRMRDGQMSKMTPGARRTMKILSGTRFQWIAYNVETKEFSGTGGGTYTTENGKYTENILFFSRDNTRVGASLQFDFAIEDGDWHHKGLSSKGDPIDELWTKREKIGL